MDKTIKAYVVPAKGHYTSGRYIVLPEHLRVFQKYMKTWYTNSINSPLGPFEFDQNFFDQCLQKIEPADTNFFYYDDSYHL